MSMVGKKVDQWHVGLMTHMAVGLMTQMAARLMTHMAVGLMIHMVVGLMTHDQARAIRIGYCIGFTILPGIGFTQYYQSVL